MVPLSGGTVHRSPHREELSQIPVSSCDVDCDATLSKGSDPLRLTCVDGDRWSVRNHEA